MRVPSVVSLLFCLVFNLAFGQDIKLPDPLKVANTIYAGTIYEKHDAVYLSFMYSEGSARVLISDCTKDVQKLLGYDSHAADEQIRADQQQQQAAAAIAAATPRPSITIHGRLLENTEKGLLVATSQDSGKIRHITQANSYANTVQSTDVPIMVTVLYLVRGNVNADYLKPGSDIDYDITPLGKDFYKGNEAIDADFIRNLNQ